MRQRGVKKLNRIVKTNLKYQTKEFFGNSTLHGVRYIAEEGRSFGEKLMWFSFVAIGAVAAFVIIASLWEKFQTNPTITGLDTEVNVHVLDFPTVIVCPIEPFDDSIDNSIPLRILTDGSNDSKIYDPNLKLLKDVTRLSYDNLKEFAEVYLKNLKYVTDWDKKSLREWAFSIAISIENVFSECKFRGELKDCEELFQRVYSERGLCFSVNPRYYGEYDIKKETFLQIFETDKSWALEFFLKKEALVYLHSVGEVFSYDNRAQFSWEPENSVELLISMKETYTTNDADQLSITQRKCIFPNEQKMNFHEDDEQYSLSACMKECRMKRAMDLCKCIPPFYIAKKNYVYCTIQKMTCIYQTAQNITDITKCSHCELSCKNTVYEIEKFSKINPTTSTGATFENERIKIEFLTWPIIQYKREVLFGWVDLLVSFGGIAGLFLGFSLLSGIEIIYYFTVRASCMMYKNREQLYEIQQEEDSRPLIKYDLSLVPKFKRSPSPSPSPSTISSESLADIQMVRPVEPHQFTYNDFDSNRPTTTENGGGNSFNIPMMLLMERNRNRHQDNMTFVTNEKIDESNRAFTTPRSLIFPMNSHIVVHEENTNRRRNDNEMQVNGGGGELNRFNRIFRPIQIAPSTQEIDQNYPLYHHRQPEDFDLVYRGYLP